MDLPSFPVPTPRIQTASTTSMIARTRGVPYVPKLFIFCLVIFIFFFCACGSSTNRRHRFGPGGPWRDCKPNHPVAEERGRSPFLLLFPRA